MAVFPKLQTGLDVNVKFNRYKVYERDGEREEGVEGRREEGGSYILITLHEGIMNCSVLSSYMCSLRFVLQI